MHNTVDFTLMPDMQVQLIFALRLVAACVCGTLIGYERSRRQKEAGLRTHIIVALGSCLATIVSKYGFFDVVINESMQVDVSRIASNLLPSIAFLGAGMIFSRGSTIKGLTTAAGVWATAAMGIAIGCGLYLVGICATVLIVCVHVALQGRQDSKNATIELCYFNGEEIPKNLESEVEKKFDCKVHTIDASRHESGNVHIKMEVRLNNMKSIDKLSLELFKDPHFSGIDVV